MYFFFRYMAGFWAFWAIASTGLMPGYCTYTAKAYNNPPIPTNLEPCTDTCTFITDAWHWPGYGCGSPY